MTDKNKPAAPALPDGFELRSFEVDLEFREAEGDKPPRIEGYAAVFDRPWSRELTDMIGITEEIAPGAFTEVLRKVDSGRQNPVLNVNHGGLPLADVRTKTLRLTEDDRGLRVSADLDPDDPDVQRIIPKLRRGTVRHMSFAFRIAKGGDAWEKIGERPSRRRITKVEILRDVTITPDPAYPDTKVALRSLEEFRSANGAGEEPPPEPNPEPAPSLEILRARAQLAEIE